MFIIRISNIKGICKSNFFNFQMFVRLFVDENLDRIVPISKQPKEKIQAIIDSCTRQFPEFAERARKRIRTYLKSCRRNKKVRGDGPTTGNGGSTPGTNSWDSAVRVRSDVFFIVS